MINVLVTAQIDVLSGLVAEAQRREESARQHRDGTEQVAKSARNDYRLALDSLRTLQLALNDLQDEHEDWQTVQSPAVPIHTNGGGA